MAGLKSTFIGIGAGFGKVYPRMGSLLQITVSLSLPVQKKTRIIIAAKGFSGILENSLPS